MPTPWTDPFTWQELIVTVAQLNEQLRDNTLHLFESKGNVRAVSTKTTTYTALATDGLILCDSASAMTINLPPCASLGAGFSYEIKNINTGNVTIDASASETIDGVLTIALGLRMASVTLRTDGSNWFVT